MCQGALARGSQIGNSSTLRKKSLVPVRGTFLPLISPYDWLLALHLDTLGLA